VTDHFAEQLVQDLPPGDVHHILGVFAADLDRLWGVLSITDDSETLRRTAHALAGAAGAVGAEGLEAACRAVMADPAQAPLALHRARLSDAVAAARSECARHLMARSA
jgi:HPt (histidine-containing phosphotransfer) domain-containing protein